MLDDALAVLEVAGVFTVEVECKGEASRVLVACRAALGHRDILERADDMWARIVPAGFLSQLGARAVLAPDGWAR